MGSAADWHAFLDEYRTFGGKAENLMQRKGAFGLGLFPIDPAKPIDLFVPDPLLVPVDDVDFVDGEVVIRDASQFADGYADWFRRYQTSYSWGAEGQERTLAFEEGLKALPDNVLSILKRNGMYNPDNRFPGKDPEKELLQRFLQTRCINRKGKRVIMPLIELLNHAPSSKAYDMKDDGISVSGMHDGEVLVKYSMSDPLRRLIGYGFNVQEPLGFSLSFRLKHRDKDVVVQGGVSKSPHQPCEVDQQNDSLIIKQPLLGSSAAPKLPRTLLIQACKEIKGVDANELYDLIQQRNTLILVNLLRQLDGVDTETAGLLRTGCLNQIVALSQHYGQRNDLLNLAEESSASSQAA